MPFLRIACGVLLLASCLLWSASASAAEYRVSYAIDAGDIKDTGTVTCEFKSTCKIKSERLQLSFELEFRERFYRDRVTIEVIGEGDRWGCCYFSDGVDHVVRSTTDTPLRLYLYAGRRRTGNEFRINEPLGILHLQFLDLK